MHDSSSLDLLPSEAHCPGPFLDLPMLPSDLFQLLTMAVAGTKVVSKRSARAFVEDGAESSDVMEFGAKRSSKFEEVGARKEDRRSSVSGSSARASISVVDESATIQVEQSSSGAAYLSPDAMTWSSPPKPMS